LSVTVNSKIAVLRLELTLVIKRGFWCDIALLFYGIVLKFFMALMFLIVINF